MSSVRFAHICDVCGKRSAEYGSWPMCAECLADVCPDCDVAKMRTEDEYNLTMCKACAAHELETA